SRRASAQIHVAHATQRSSCASGIAYFPRLSVSFQQHSRLCTLQLMLLTVTLVLLPDVIQSGPETHPWDVSGTKPGNAISRFLHLQ
ncbi:MAG: hypothetical protein KDI83_20505, partial [Gammaproteobacteria bacterium]|nr:hypothetical protein [Gammaproteobacteria bacterium]